MPSSASGPHSVQHLPQPLGPLEPGMELDGFRLEERMHQGGMAHIWRVTRVQPSPVKTFR